MTARKIAEIPQPIYVIKVRMVAWRRLVIGSLERSCKKSLKKRKEKRDETEKVLQNGLAEF